MKKIIFGLSVAFGLTTGAGVISNLHAQSRVVKEEYKTKKPWSHRKKDAVIGAGAGAVTGAIIGHGAKGAVVGGVVGGGAGYLIGKHKDRTHPVPERKTTYVVKRRS